MPCFIKALQLLRRQDEIVRERVAFTLGLFCGHMKSARFAESLAWQMGVEIENVSRVEFRLKDPTRAASVYTGQLTLRDGSVVKRDWWNLADGDWGAGFFQNSACNFCDDVVAETADVSFGDAWVEPYSSDGRGTNVVVVRAPVVADFIADAIREKRLQLENVDAEFVHQTQAAGFRQRREGLAYRLSWPRFGVKPRKRVQPRRATIPARRRSIYRMRALNFGGRAIVCFGWRAFLGDHKFICARRSLVWMRITRWLTGAVNGANGWRVGASEVGVFPHPASRSSATLSRREKENRGCNSEKLSLFLLPPGEGG